MIFFLKKDAAAVSAWKATTLPPRELAAPRRASGFWEEEASRTDADALSTPMGSRSHNARQRLGGSGLGQLHTRHPHPLTHEPHEAR